MRGISRFYAVIYAAVMLVICVLALPREPLSAYARPAVGTR